MKSTARILNKRQLDYLFFHLLDGFFVTREGALQLWSDNIIKSDEELLDLLLRNEERLRARIRDFRLANRLLCVFFAAIFSFCQVTGEDTDLRKPARTRTRRRELSI